RQSLLDHITLQLAPRAADEIWHGEGQLSTIWAETLITIVLLFIYASSLAVTNSLCNGGPSCHKGQIFNLKGSSPLTQTGMVNFVPGRAVIDVAQRKRGKYMDRCAAIGYGFLPFSFSSLGELETDAVTLLKRIRKFSITQDVGLNHVEDLLHDQHGGFTLALLDSLFSNGLRIVKSIPPSSVFGGSLHLVREVLAELPPPLLDVDEEDYDLGERNMKQCKRKIWDGHFTAAVKILSSSGVSPYNDATLEDLKSKHPLKPAPLLPHIPIDHHHLIASPAMVLDRIKSFP
ncbi:hypothetical protein Tco_1297603, partial [Tanacetum coccineum]